MIRVHTSPSAVAIHNLKNVLEAEGIRCEIRGEFRRAATGEIPINECWVELWIVDDAQQERARGIVGGPTGAALQSWTCGACDEVVEGQFGQCWNCQAESPS